MNLCLCEWVNFSMNGPCGIRFELLPNNIHWSTISSDTCCFALGFLPSLALWSLYLVPTLLLLTVFHCHCESSLANLAYIRTFSAPVKMHQWSSFEPHLHVLPLSCHTQRWARSTYREFSFEPLLWYERDQNNPLPRFGRVGLAWFVRLGVATSFDLRAS